MRLSNAARKVKLQIFSSNGQNLHSLVQKGNATTMSSVDETHMFMRNTFLKAVAAVLPHKLIRSRVSLNGQCLKVCDRSYALDGVQCYMVGFGKAVIGMAAEIERILGSRLVEAIVSVPDGIQETLQGQQEMLPKVGSAIQVIEGAKDNLPDERALNAAQKIEKLVCSLDARCLLIVLISGGGSALLPLPKLPVTLQEKCYVIKNLAGAGANIFELNCVRKKLSVLKGGGLAKLAYPAQVVSLILSDVVKDPLDIIASGPTVVNTDSSEKVMNIIHKYSLQENMSASLLSVLGAPPGCDCNIPVESNNFCHVQNEILGNNSLALHYAFSEACMQNYCTALLSTAIEGPISAVVQFYVQFVTIVCELILRKISSNDFIKKINCLRENHSYITMTSTLANDILNTVSNIKNSNGLCIIAGGEPTVIVTGQGLGGRNQQLCLMFALEICKNAEMYSFLREFDVSLLSAGTDGIDGPTDAAGAIGYQQQIAAAKAQNLQPEAYLTNNDSNGFYRALRNGHDLICTGHTGTNVMDIHMLVIKWL